MIFCTKCGAKLPDESQFCEECGTRVEVAVQAAVSGQNDAAPAAGAAPDSPDAAGVPGEPAAPGYGKVFDSAIPANVTPFPLKNKKINKLAIIIPLVVVVLAVVAFGWIKLAPKMGDVEEPIIYIKDSDALCFYNTSMKKSAKIASVSSNDGYGIHLRLSEDNKQLLYLDSQSDGNLYLRNVDSEKPNNKDKSERGIKLASDVSNVFFFTKNGQYAVYVKKDGGLYYHDKKEAHKLDSDISEYSYPQITDQNRIFYYKSDSAGKYALYSQVIGAKNDEKIKVDGDFSYTSYLEITEDGQFITYTKDNENQDDNYNNTDVYRYSIKTQDKEKLISSAGNVLDIDADSGTIAYVKNNKMTLDVFEVLGLDDDMAASDAAMTEPRTQDYQKKEQGIFGEHSVIDYDAFNAAVEAYYKKLERDNMRENLLRNNEMQTRDVYVYKAGQETKLASGLIGGASDVYSYSVEDGFLVYSMCDLKNQNTIKMSSITDYYSFESNFSNNPSSKLYYVPLSGGEAKPFHSLSGSERVISISVSDNKKSLAFVAGSNDKGELYNAALSSGGIAEPVKADDDVSSIIDSYDDTFLYIKDEKNSVGTLHSLTGSNKKKIADDVSTYSVYLNGDGNTISFYKDWNSSQTLGDYYLVSGEAKRISSDVAQAYYRNDKLIYLLKNYSSSSNKGDLFAYVGKSQLITLDYDVNFVYK